MMKNLIIRRFQKYLMYDISLINYQKQIKNTIYECWKEDNDYK